MNTISAVLQIGAVVYAVVMTILFNIAEAKARDDQRAAMPEIDLSDVPPFLDE